MVVLAGGALSGRHRAASILKPSIALIARKSRDAPASGCISWCRPAGRGAASYSMLAATWAAPAAGGRRLASAQATSGAASRRDVEAAERLIGILPWIF